METVSASELVRHFGKWQDRAMHAPVYVRHHGRPRLVLASVDFMRQLVDAGSAAGAMADSQSILEMMPVIAITTDADLVVQAISPAARALMEGHRGGGMSLTGVALDTIVRDSVRPIIVRAAAQVLATGNTETFLLHIGGEPPQRLDVTVGPYDGGIAIVARDLSDADARFGYEAAHDAIGHTLEMLGDVAIVRINQRGFVMEASASFGKLTGLSTMAYRSVRFPTLFDPPSRVIVGEALERSIDHMEPQTLSARLMVNRGAPRDIRIAMSPHMLRAAMGVVMATIVAC